MHLFQTLSWVVASPRESRLAAYNSAASDGAVRSDAISCSVCQRASAVIVAQLQKFRGQLSEDAILSTVEHMCSDPGVDEHLLSDGWGVIDDGDVLQFGRVPALLSASTLWDSFTKRTAVASVSVCARRTRNAQRCRLAGAPFWKALRTLLNFFTVHYARRPHL
mmetsp:Transcript_17690/g.38948  ORF Transcript_17690/g.38948 Transcript_17690/m.38948 type:complete len:164 (+) Transcript_17690:2391-2882(+)